MVENFQGSKIEQLDSSNYAIWSMKMEAFLDAKGLFEDVILQEEPLDHFVLGVTASTRNIWSRKNKEALSFIILSLSSEIAVTFYGIKKAKIIWDTLKERYHGKDEDRCTDLILALTTVRQKQNESIDKFILRAQGISRQIAILGGRTSDRELCRYVTNGLSEKFKSIKDILRVNRTLSIEQMRGILQDFEREHDIVDTNAFKTDFSYKRQNKNCYGCGQQGHLLRDCKRTKYDKKFGAHRQQSPSRRFYSNNFTPTKDENVLTCDLDQTEHALSAERDTNTQISHAEWVLDSGCSVHMTSTLSYLQCKQPSDKLVKVAEAKRTIEATFEGEIHGVIESYSKRKVILKKVLFVPQLRCNLLSIPEMIANGNKVFFSREMATIINSKGETVFTAKQKGGIFIVTLGIETGLQDQNAFVTEINENNIWHFRLGHPSDIVMQKMATSGFLPAVDHVNIRQELCEPCVLGGMVRSPFNKHLGKTTARPLQLIHADLMGPMPVPSIGNSFFVLVIVDNFSGCYFVEFLRTKSEATDKLIAVINLLERTTDNFVHRLRTDNGGEFTGSVLKSYLETKGIKHEFTVPYSPQSNGAAERANRTLMEKARKMLIASTLPDKFWAESLLTASYLYNRTIKMKTGKTPLEMFTGQRPNIFHIRVFGCHCFYTNNVASRQKLDLRAKQGIFVGYARNRQAYRIFDENKNDVVESRDVKFDETSYGLQSTDVGFSANPVLNQRFQLNENTEDLPPTIELFEKEPIPENFGEATKCFSSKSWIAAMDREMNSMSSNDVWEVVERKSTDKNVIKSKWIYSKKKDRDGKWKFKARLVASGWNLKQGLDYAASFSPVVPLEMFRLLLIICFKLDYKHRFFDIETAYLNAPLSEECYMELPKGYEQNDKICKLKRSIYGLPQSGKAWNTLFHDILVECGFKRLQKEPCLYVANEVNCIVVAAIYVDDFCVIAKDEGSIQKYTNLISKKVTVKDVTDDKSFLGLEIDFNKKELWIHQRSQIEKVLNKYNMSNCNTVSTPIATGNSLDDYENSEKVEQKLYQQLIGSLIYIATGTRLDISFAVSRLSQYSSDPREIHLKAAKRVLRYLNGTKDFGLVFSRNQMQLNIWSDASWSTMPESKSLTGYLAKLGDEVFGWKAKKQDVVALSSMEAETYALCEGVREANWIMEVLQELGVTEFFELPIQVHTDSKSAIEWVKSESITFRTKHILRKFHFVRDEYQAQRIDLIFKPSKEMHADLMTKALPKVDGAQMLEKLNLKPRR